MFVADGRLDVADSGSKDFVTPNSVFSAPANGAELSVDQQVLPDVAVNTGHRSIALDGHETTSTGACSLMSIRNNYYRCSLSAVP